MIRGRNRRADAVLARVTLDGDGLAGFEPVAFTDGYVSVAIPQTTSR